jgi:drug/metabolite transporter (DMT)-like permease
MRVATTRLTTVGPPTDRSSFPVRSIVMPRLAIAPRDLVYLILAAACWGLGTVISKRAVAEVPPITLLTIQLATSVGLLAILFRRNRPTPNRPAPEILTRLGLLNPGLAYALSLIGLVTISASLSVVLWALEPILIVLLSGAVLHERVTGSFMALSLIAVAGMAIVAYDPAGGGQLVGIALTLAGVACCAVYTVLVKRLLPGADSTGEVVLGQQAYALALAAALAVLVAIIGGSVLPAAISPLGIVSALASGAVYYAGAYWFYLGALRHVPASRAVVAFYLIPIVGVIASVGLLGDRLDGRQWIGVILVVGATLASLRDPSGQPDLAASRRT